jgi:hypothetical protein
VSDFRKSVEKIHVSLKSDNNNFYFSLHENPCIFMISSSVLLTFGNILDEICRENENIHIAYLVTFSSKLCCLMRYCGGLVCTDRCTPGLYITDTQRITQSVINHCNRFARISAGTEELPGDDTHVSKHVGAAE